MDEFDIFTLFFSLKGVSIIMETGVIGIQCKTIKEQKDKINAYEDNISDIEQLLITIIKRQDTPKDIKELTIQTIKKIKAETE